MEELKDLYFQIRKVKEKKEMLVTTSGITVFIMAIVVFFGIIQTVAIDRQIYMINDLWMPIGIAILIVLVLIYVYVLFLTHKEYGLRDKVDLMKTK